ncbi:MAG: OsmC family protein [Bauldia sp.]|nr:OsmC family protein [Bauldia sp.]
MPTRTAQANWQGSLAKGNGHMKFADYDGPFTFASRFEAGKGTNPEELIGAAIAGCFSMALSGDLGGAGFSPDEISTTAKVTVEPKDGGGFVISGIHLDTVASVPGVSDADFQRIAEGTKSACPVSTALRAVPITLTAKLA